MTNRMSGTCVAWILGGIMCFTAAVHAEKYMEGESKILASNYETIKEAASYESATFSNDGTTAEDLYFTTSGTSIYDTKIVTDDKSFTSHDVHFDDPLSYSDSSYKGVYETTETAIVTKESTYGATAGVHYSSPNLFEFIGSPSHEKAGTGEKLFVQVVTVNTGLLTAKMIYPQAVFRVMDMDAVVTRVESRGRKGFSFAGDLVGKETGWFVFTWLDGVLVGNLYIGEAAYALHYGADALYRLSEMPRLPDDFCGAVEKPFGLFDSYKTEKSELPDPDVWPGAGGFKNAIPVVDLLVVYTPRARQERGGPAAIRAEIENAAFAMNHALENSGAGARVNLAAALEIDLEELGTGTDDELARLGELPQVVALRDLVGADLVALVIAGEAMQEGNLLVAGRASIRGAYSVQYARYIVGRVIPHELGHNLGAHHDIECGGFNRGKASMRWSQVDINHGDRAALQQIIHIGPVRADQIIRLREISPFSCVDSLDRVDGIALGGVRLDDIKKQNVATVNTADYPHKTIMAYGAGQQIPHFSNPHVFYEGLSTGIADSRDNARAITEQAPRAAQYRPAVVYPGCFGEPADDAYVVVGHDAVSRGSDVVYWVNDSPESGVRPRIMEFVIDLREPDFDNGPHPFVDAEDPIVVEYKTVDGSAKAGVDYVPREGRIVLHSGKLRETIWVFVKDTEDGRSRDKAFALDIRVVRGAEGIPYCTATPFVAGLILDEPHLDVAGRLEADARERAGIPDADLPILAFPQGFELRDGQYVVDVLALYTPAARQAYNQSPADTTAAIARGLEETNEAFVNSEVPVRLRLLLAAETADEEERWLDGHLEHIAGDPHASAWRDAIGADLVVFAVGDDVLDQGADAGLPRLPLEDPDNAAARAFSSIRLPSQAGAFPRIIGRNLGGGYEDAFGLHVFSHPYRLRVEGDPRVHYTLMGWLRDGVSIPHFSNPRVLYEGVPTGVAGFEAGAVDNALTFSISAPWVSGYRPTVLPDCGWREQPPEQTIHAWEVDRDANQIVFSIALSQPAAEPVEVFYRTRNGSAIAGVEYQEQDASVILPAGEVIAHINVPVLNPAPGTDKLFYLHLYSVAGGDACIQDAFLEGRIIR